MSWLLLLEVLNPLLNSISFPVIKKFVLCTSKKRINGSIFVGNVLPVHGLFSSQSYPYHNFTDFRCKGHIQNPIRILILLGSGSCSVPVLFPVPE